MKVRYTKHFPQKGFVAINLFGFIFARREYAPLNKKVVNHELIHTAQIRELVFIFFYIWYGLEWLVRLIQYKSFLDAYYNISFEREAYTNEVNLSYLNTRKRFSFIKYLK